MSLALRRALTVQNIEKGFQVTGIWPWDDSTMAAKMGPSEVFQAEVEDAADAVMQLQIEEISMDVSEPENPEAQHFYIQIEEVEGLGADGVASEGLHGAGLGGLGLSPDEPRVSDEDIRLHHEPPPSISTFLTLPEVTVSRQQRRSEALTDYSKSIILTSENYISMMEEKSARREVVERAKAEKQ